MTTDSEDFGEDLGVELGGIVSHAKSQGLNIFYGDDISGSEGIEIRWRHKDDDGEGWKFFIDVGKTEGVTTLVVEERSLQEDEIDRLVEELPEDLKHEIPPGGIERARKLVGKVGALRLLWIKNGVKYSYYKSTDWFDDAAELFAMLDKPERPKLTTSEGFTFGRHSLPENVKRQTPETLAEEMLSFLKREYGGLDSRMLFSASRVFWEKKGVSQFGDADTELLRDKVDGIVQMKIAEVEREEIPKMVEVAVAWCKENGFRKLTKQNLKAFLAEKNASFSKPSEDILLTRVNVKLAQ